VSETIAPPNAAGVELCYETFGDPADPTVLLIMGLATQMIAWDERFCAMLVERGFHVVRFDNRDVGRSSRMKGAPPTLGQLVARSKKAARYTLSDMAADAVSLLDHLGIERAHVVGASMGGMIAQTMAIEHPGRVLSLVSIMSNAGGRLRGQPKLAVYPALLKRAPAEREAYAQYTAKTYAMIGSPGFERDDEAVAERGRRAFDRGVSAAGSGRQLAAVLAGPPRKALLRQVRVPTLVIHGSADPLVSPSGGREVANAIPGAELKIIEGMGHDLPPGVWPPIVEGIAATAARASSAAQPAAAR
jgi:pimeloyl-ACP methyl ester carboxylesterase